jgi:hypothetical protein
MEEQRKARRVPFSAALEQLIIHRSDYPRLGGDDLFVEARALNLSSGGLACESPAKMETSSLVYLIFSLPTPEGSRRIRCEGDLTHSSFEDGRCVFGIRFDGLSREDQSAIDAFVDAAHIDLL